MGPLMKLGFAIIAPDSFARTNRYEDCYGRNTNTKIRQRAQEAKYAAEKAGDLPWVDVNNLFLIGHSEGGAGAAAYYGNQYNAIAISGNSCENGIASNIPTLVAVSRGDKQLVSPERICLRAQERIILPGSQHYMLRNKEVADRVVKFFSEHLKPKRVKFMPNGTYRVCFLLPAIVSNYPTSVMFTATRHLDNRQ